MWAIERRTDHKWTARRACVLRGQAGHAHVQLSNGESMENHLSKLGELQTVVKQCHKRTSCSRCACSRLTEESLSTVVRTAAKASRRRALVMSRLRIVVSNVSQLWSQHLGIG